MHSSHIGEVLPPQNLGYMLPLTYMRNRCSVLLAGNARLNTTGLQQQQHLQRSCYFSTMHNSSRATAGQIPCTVGRQGCQEQHSAALPLVPAFLVGLTYATDTCTMSVT
jgi:hypothetical protein